MESALKKIKGIMHVVQKYFALFWVLFAYQINEGVLPYFTNILLEKIVKLI